MPSKKAKERKYARKIKAAEVKRYKRAQSKIKKIKHVKDDGYVYYEYANKKEINNG